MVSAAAGDAARPRPARPRVAESTAAPTLRLGRRDLELIYKVLLFGVCDGFIDTAPENPAPSEADEPHGENAFCVASVTNALADGSPYGRRRAVSTILR